MMLNERAKQELQAMPRELLGKTLPRRSRSEKGQSGSCNSNQKYDRRRNSRSVKGMEDRF